MIAYGFAGLSSNSVVSFSSRVGVHQTGVDREPVGTNLELGELEQLTINNDNESSSYEVKHFTFFAQTQETIIITSLLDHCSKRGVSQNVERQIYSQEPFRWS